MRERLRGLAQVVVVTAAAAAGCTPVEPVSSSQFGLQVEHRSAFAHVTDGAFTDLDGNRATDPRSGRTCRRPSSRNRTATSTRIRPTSGRTPARRNRLMYDEVGLTTPRGPTDYFLVSFTTVEVEGGGEKLQHYNIHVFADGTIIFLENGVPQTTD